MILNLDHIAILTADIRQVGSSLPTWLLPHKLEEQPSEGTLEQYACPNSANDPCLLLMQAISSGPYLKAFKKRGAGLHHIAYATDDIDDAVTLFAGHGLLLHPISLTTYSDQVVWMCRPGIPFMLELFQPAQISQLDQTQTTVDIPPSILKAQKNIEFLPSILITAGRNNQIGIQMNQNRCVIDLSV